MQASGTEDRVSATVARSAVDCDQHRAGGKTCRNDEDSLVDDSRFLRLATERALARAVYEVSTAADGEHALQLAREKRPDVILLDLLLPKMTGPNVLKAAEERSRDGRDCSRGPHGPIAEEREPPGA